jgi:hypothetical protein
MATVLDRDFMFFMGPAYYVSKKAMQYIRRAGLKMYSEDASVGYALTPHIKDLKFCEVRWIDEGMFLHPNVNPLKQLHTISVDASVPETVYKKIIDLCQDKGWTFVFCPESEQGGFDEILSKWFHVPYEQENKDWALISLEDFFNVSSLSEELTDILITASS